MIFDWIADASASKREQRIAAFSRLVGEIKVQAQRFDQCQAAKDRKGMDEARDRIHQLLKDFADKLPVKK